MAETATEPVAPEAATSTPAITPPTIGPAKAKDTLSVDPFVAATLKADQANWDLGKQMSEAMARLVPKYEAAKKEEALTLEARGKRLEKISDKAEAIGKKVEEQEVPEPKPEPPVPHITSRPFGEGLPGEAAGQVLNRVAMQLGLLAQMGVGLAKGHPQGAIAAYTGALQGWMAGDDKRAQQEWLEYQAQVNKGAREWKKAVDAFELTRQKYEGQTHQLGVQLGIEAVKAGMDDKRVATMFRDYEEGLRQIGMEGKLWQDVIDGTRKANQAIWTAKVQKDAHDIQREHLAQQREMFAQRMKEREQKQSAADQKHDAQVADMEFAVKNMKALVPEMQRKGYLPAAPGPYAAAKAWTNRQMGMGDQTLSNWDFHQQTIVGFDRTIMNDLGRAQSAYAAGQEFVKHPPTLEAVNRVLNYMDDLVRVEKASRAAGRHARLPDEPATPPAPPPFGAPGGQPPLTKEQYETIRKRGYSDDEIRAKGFQVPQ